MSKVAQLVEELSEKGQVNPQLIREAVEEEVNQTAEELIKRIEGLISQIEGMECPKCEEIKTDLEDALNYLESDEVSEDDLAEIADWLDEVEEMLAGDQEEEEED